MAQKIINFGPSSIKWNTACARELLFGELGETISGTVTSVTLKIKLSQSESFPNIESYVSIFPYSNFQTDWITDKNILWEKRENNGCLYLYQNIANDYSPPSSTYYRKSTKEEKYGITKEKCLAEKTFIFQNPGEGFLEKRLTFNDGFDRNLSNWTGTVLLAFCDNATNSNNTGLIIPNSGTSSYWVDKTNNVFAQLIIEYTQESTGELVSDRTILGETSTINITSYNSNYTHTVTWQCGKESETKTLSVGQTSTSFVIPDSWGAEFPNTRTFNGSVTLTTYLSNSKIGDSKIYQIIYEAPAVAPSIEEPNISYSHGNYFKNWTYSPLDNTRIHLTNVSTAIFSFKPFINYGANISAIKVQRDGKNIANSIKDSICSFSLSGAEIFPASSFTVTISITDSRGNIGTANIEGIIYEYIFPSVNIVFYRCDEDGIKNQIEGKWVTFKDTQIIGGQLPMVVASSSQIYESGSYLLSINNKNYSFEEMIEIGEDTNVIYSLTIFDNAGYSKTITGTISAINYLLHFRKKNNQNGYQSLGIGCPAPEADNRLDIGWSTNINSGELKVPLLRIKHPTSFYPGITFHTPESNSDDTLSVGTILCNTNSDNRRIYFEEYPLYKINGETLNNGDERVREFYFLPVPSNSLNSSVYYNIHTTKNVIAPEYGGTGVTSITALKNSLGLPSTVPEIIYRVNAPTEDEVAIDGAILLVPIS